MDNKTLKAEYGLNGVQLALLTGQDPNTISRKLRGDQGLKLGSREAGVLALWSFLTDDQREQALARYSAVLNSLTD